MNAEQLITSLNQQYSLGTLRRNLAIYLYWRVDHLSFVEIGRKYHLSKQRVEQVVAKMGELLASINQQEVAKRADAGLQGDASPNATPDTSDRPLTTGDKGDQKHV